MILKKKYFAPLVLILAFAFVSCSTDDEKEEKEVVQEDNYEFYEDVEFEVAIEDLNTQRFYATSTGTMYTYNDITEEIAPTIDLVWSDMSASNSGFMFFDSPDDLFQDEQIEGATTTKIENTGDMMTAEEFDAIEDASAFDEYTIVQEDEAMGPVDYPIVVLFENAAGKKGAIKMKSKDGDVLTVDIKVVK